ncbi:MAG: 30S ribosomal protein S16 [Actinomycetota bacterium]|nr:30S ribosomal protein S16 [Actinomycetota bacterium]
MVKIRLMRVGKKKQPSFRVVVADSRSPRDGRIIEAIGHYHPRQEPSEIEVNGERAVYWLKQGAQPSSAVRKLLQISGAWSEFTGEPQPGAAPPSRARAGSVKATPADSVKATRAASVDAPEEPPADLSEAEDQAAAAPDARPERGRG